jgi:hypothetical protein
VVLSCFCCCCCFHTKRQPTQIYSKHLTRLLFAPLKFNNKPWWLSPWNPEVLSYLSMYILRQFKIRKNEIHDADILFLLSRALCSLHSAVCFSVYCWIIHLPFKQIMGSLPLNSLDLTERSGMTYLWWPIVDCNCGCQ